MANAKLVLYIKDTLLKGHKLSEIKLKLKERGYSEKEIISAIDSVHAYFEKSPRE